MLKRQKDKKNNKIKVTFVLPGDLPRVSVAGDFNDWNLDSHPLQRRSNGTRSAAVLLDPGKRYRFRYYNHAEERWFNDTDADGYEPCEFGVHNCIVTT
jgi:1,4-alpha-glucan branching enzyme